MQAHQVSNPTSRADFEHGGIYIAGRNFTRSSSVFLGRRLESAASSQPAGPTHFTRSATGPKVGLGCRFIGTQVVLCGARPFASGYGPWELGHSHGAWDEYRDVYLDRQVNKKSAVKLVRLDVWFLTAARSPKATRSIPCKAVRLCSYTAVSHDLATVEVHHSVAIQERSYTVTRLLGQRLHCPPRALLLRYARARLHGYSITRLQVTHTGA